MLAGETGAWDDFGQTEFQVRPSCNPLCLIAEVADRFELYMRHGGPQRRPDHKGDLTRSSREVEPQCSAQLAVLPDLW